MSETDALSQFDFSSFGGAGLFLKFKAGEDVVLRVLTVDPIVSQVEYVDKKTDEITLSTKFSFIVYNFTHEKAQILQATPNMATKIGKLHTDEDFGANIRNIDIKISPTGEKLERRYDLQVLPIAKQLTQNQIEEAKAINLDEKVGGQRMSFYKPEDTKVIPEIKDEIIEDTDEPINLDNIPF